MTTALLSTIAQDIVQTSYLWYGLLVTERRREVFHGGEEGPTLVAAVATVNFRGRSHCLSYQGSRFWSGSPLSSMDRSDGPYLLTQTQHPWEKTKASFSISYAWSAWRETQIILIMLTLSSVILFVFVIFFVFIIFVVFVLHFFRTNTTRASKGLKPDVLYIVVLDVVQTIRTETFGPFTTKEYAAANRTFPFRTLHCAATAGL